LQYRGLNKTVKRTRFRQWFELNVLNRDISERVNTSEQHSRAGSFCGGRAQNPTRHFQELPSLLASSLGRDSTKKENHVSAGPKRFKVADFAKLGTSASH
jgi:hypothetical protein